MSAFLGPIHYWLFTKIQRQEALTMILFRSFLSKEEQAKVQDEMNAACGQIETRSLECIDTGNIHGSLQKQIAIAEFRFAFLVTNLIQRGQADLEQLKQAVFQAGTECALSARDTLSAFQELNDILLDGMPCDRVNVMIEETPEQVVWQQTQCLHSEYWLRAGGDVSVYYTLRAEWISGMLKGSGLVYHYAGDMHKIRKELTDEKH